MLFLYLVIQRQEEFKEWLQSGGYESSVHCQNRTAKLICMNHFPPCRSKEHYAIYPCHENCLSYYQFVFVLIVICRVCGAYTSQEWCPTDGPDYNATIPGEGVHSRSNNALWSCFDDDHSIRP